MLVPRLETTVLTIGTSHNQPKPAYSKYWAVFLRGQRLCFSPLKPASETAEVLLSPNEVPNG
jgi:hypothetical protein